MIEIVDSSYSPKSGLQAVKFLRKMRGGAQSSLVKADDGNFYIVKALGNPQGNQVLFNEALASELMRIIGLPVPNWRTIHISDEFICQNPELWFETSGSGRKRPQAGLCFGSSLVNTGEGEALYELLPVSWMDLIANRADFIGMLLFDLWVNQTDNRQAVFLQNTETRSIRATFIDQGFTLGHDQGRVEVGKIRGMYLDRRIYETLDSAKILPKWKSRIQAIDGASLRSLLSCMPIPKQWSSSLEMEGKVEGLLRRQSRLDVFAACIQASLALHSSTFRERSELLTWAPLDPVKGVCMA
jgi:hypothetical protein